MRKRNFVDAFIHNSEKNYFAPTYLSNLFKYNTKNLFIFGACSCLNYIFPLIFADDIDNKRIKHENEFNQKSSSNKKVLKIDFQPKPKKSISQTFLSILHNETIVGAQNIHTSHQGDLRRTRHVK